jgi:hypothetical protein
MSHILVAEMSYYFNGENSKFSEVVYDSVERVDDIVEIL